MDETQAFFDKSNRKLTLAKTAYSMEDCSDAGNPHYKFVATHTINLWQSTLYFCDNIF